MIQTHNSEVWLQIPYHPNYECSNLGNVRRLLNEKQLKFAIHDNGYYNVMLYTDNKKYNRRVSKLVWETFNDQICGKTIDHIDRNKLNNNISNLRCVSNRENCNNKIYRPKQTNKYNLTDEIKKEIITKFNTGEWTSYSINKKFGIPSNYICMVKKRGTWNKLLNDGKSI